VSEPVTKSGGSSELRVETTAIPGLVVLRLPLHGDNRGWFKENWQREKMVGLGLPDFGPVQNNVSFNDSVGVTRGVHAEPWDKFVSLASGRIFGAWVDLRAGDSFGRVFTLEMGPEVAIFVPRGVGNSYQTLVENTAYSYLVNDHWSPAARESYTFVNIADPALGIEWPIDLADAELSEADRSHPPLAEVAPFPARRSLVVGAAGQVGQELRDLLPDADALSRAELDLLDPDLATSVDWGSYDVVYNTAAFTAVDAAETPEGRRSAWQVNVAGTGRLVELARRHRLTVVHFSSDYVFDGQEKSHPEDEKLSPLGVYGQTKAAADVLVSTLPSHYILRTSWVIGRGGNFVSTMASLAEKGVSPSVVDDQVGRLSFAPDLARAALHLVTGDAEPGIYNVTCGGPAASWADIAREVFRILGRDPDDVTRVSTEDYGRGKQMAPRPPVSTLDLTKIERTGFVPPDGFEALAAYLTGEAGTGPTAARRREGTGFAE
jgi:dTDP-4-dehydrorhamnose reductase